MNKQMLTGFVKANVPNIMVSEEALEKIAEHFEERTFLKNDFLLKAGKNSGYFYLAEGFMRAFTYDIHIGMDISNIRFWCLGSNSNHCKLPDHKSGSCRPGEEFENSLN